MTPAEGQAAGATRAQQSLPQTAYAEQPEVDEEMVLAAAMLPEAQREQFMDVMPTFFWRQFFPFPFFICCCLCICVYVRMCLCVSVCVCVCFFNFILFLCEAGI